MAKRKLSRIASNPRDVVVSKVMCVSGVRLKTPAPIQIEEKGEQGEFAVVSSRTPWLNEVLCGVKSDSKMHDLRFQWCWHTSAQCAGAGQWSFGGDEQNLKYGVAAFEPPYHSDRSIQD